MKSTKTVLAVAIVIGGFVSFGCGSDVSGGVSLADARDTCDSAYATAFGQPLPEIELDTLFIQAEAARDSGISEISFLQAITSVCIDSSSTDERANQCIICFTAITAAVWP